MMLSRSDSALTRVLKQSYSHVLMHATGCLSAFRLCCRSAGAGAHVLEAEWMASLNLGRSDSQTQLNKLLFFINYPDVGILL